MDVPPLFFPADDSFSYAMTLSPLFYSVRCEPQTVNFGSAEASHMAASAECYERTADDVALDDDLEGEMLRQVELELTAAQLMVAEASRNRAHARKLLTRDGLPEGPWAVTLVRTQQMHQAALARQHAQLRSILADADIRDIADIRANAPIGCNAPARDAAANANIELRAWEEPKGAAMRLAALTAAAAARHRRRATATLLRRWTEWMASAVSATLDRERSRLHRQNCALQSSLRRWRGHLLHLRQLVLFASVPTIPRAQPSLRRALRTWSAFAAAAAAAGAVAETRIRRRLMCRMRMHLALWVAVASAARRQSVRCQTADARARARQLRCGWAAFRWAAFRRPHVLSTAAAAKKALRSKGAAKEGATPRRTERRTERWRESTASAPNGAAAVEAAREVTVPHAASAYKAATREAEIASREVGYFFFSPDVYFSPDVFLSPDVFFPPECSSHRMFFCLHLALFRLRRPERCPRQRRRGDSSSLLLLLTRRCVDGRNSR